MDKKLGSKPCLFVNITGNYDVLSKHGEKLDSRLPSLSSLLSEGISVILCHEEGEITKNRFNLLSILGFGNTINDPEYISSLKTRSEDMKVREDFLGEDKYTGKGTAAADEDEIPEIKYIKLPRKLNEVAPSTNLLVITNDNELLPHLVKFEISYRLQNWDTTAVDNFTKENPLQRFHIVFLDCRLPDDDTVSLQLLENLDKLLGTIKSSHENIQIRFTISPAFTAFNKDSVLYPNKLQLKEFPTGTQEMIKDILPIQIWETLQAEPNPEIHASKLFFSFGCTWDSIGRRIDTITQFKSLNKEDTLQLIGNKTIRGEFFFREILFTLGKIPKYGS